MAFHEQRERERGRGRERDSSTGGDNPFLDANIKGPSTVADNSREDHLRVEMSFRT